MPIRVNLKEIFPSDPQEITVEKVNFNFNKLLELGVGEAGERGFSGIEGPAGPGGLLGPQGLRGSTWFVDAGDPNTLTGFVDLIDNDLYLNSLTFDVWQYDLATDTWSIVASLSTIINNYLSTGTTTFTRGIGLGSPDDDRFIVFNRRGNDYIDSQQDIQRGLLNNANSDILFLNNFNEDTLNAALANFNFTATPGDLFNSLLKIYVNHIDGTASLAGRYHIELGSLYEDDSVFPAEVKMSDIKHNLKIKFFKEDVALTTNFPNTNKWINTARFSLSLPEPAALFTNIDQNAVFEFATPKINAEGMSTLYAETTVRFGGEEALTEQNTSPDMTGDGISITSVNELAQSRSFSLGIKRDLDNVYSMPPSIGTEFAMINVSDEVDGAFINSNLIQSNGKILQIQTTEIDYLTKLNASNAGNSNARFASVFSNSRYLIQTRMGSAQYAAASYSSAGYFGVHQLVPEFYTLATLTENSGYDNTAPLIYDNHGHQTTRSFEFPGNNITDVAFAGKYGYMTRILPQVGFVIPPITNRPNNNTFHIFELDSSGYGVQNISNFGISNPEYYSLVQVKVVGETAYVLRRKETTADWTQTTSGLIALDVSDPVNVIEKNIYSSSTDHVYLSFDINEEKAVVSYLDEGTNQLRLQVFDIHDPSALSAGANVTVLASGATDVPAPIKMEGRYLFLGYQTKLYVYRFNSFAAPQAYIIGGFEVDPDIEIRDIIINGKYAYVLGEDLVTGNGKLITVDIRNVAGPIVVSTVDRANMTAPGKMTLFGNKIYVATSNGTGALSAQVGGLLTFELDSLITPSADISSLNTDHLKVTNEAYIARSLDVGQSINIGSGGLYVDEGRGVTSDGPILCVNAEGRLTRIENRNYTGVNARQIFGNTNSLTDVSTDSSILLNYNYLNKVSAQQGTYLSYDYLYGLDITGPLIGNQIVFAGGDESSTATSFYGMNVQATGTYNFLTTTAFPLELTTDSFTGIRLSVAADFFTTPTDVETNNFYGIDLDLRSGLTVNNDTYGYRFRFTGNSSGTVYGIHVTGADDNYFEGNVTIEDNVVLDGAGTAFYNPSGSISFDDFVYHGINDYVISSGHIEYNYPANWAGTLSMNWIRIGNIVTVHFRGRLKNDTDADLSGSIIATPHQGGTIRLVEGHGHIQIVAASGSAAANSGFGNISVKLQNSGPVPAVELYHMDDSTVVGIPTGDGNKLVRGTFSYEILA